MDNSMNPRDQRRSDRKSPDAVVPVINAVTGEQLGQVGNISAEGLMLICRQEVEPGHLFQLCFAMPNARGDEQAFNIGATCLWCSETHSGGTWWAGFEIMDISDDDALALHDIMNAL